MYKIFVSLLIWLAWAPSYLSAQLLEEIKQDRFAAAFHMANYDSAEVTMHLIILSGEADNQGPRGLAHFVEHLAWYSAFPRVNRQFTGHNNAWTYRETTHFEYRVRKEAFEKGLSELNTVFKPLDVTEEFVTSERDIIHREFDYGAEAFDNQPASQKMNAALHGKNPLMRNVLGTRQNIDQFTFEFAKQYHSDFYRPENAILVIIGDMDLETSQAMLLASDMGVVSEDVKATRRAVKTDEDDEEIRKNGTDVGKPLVYSKLEDAKIHLNLSDASAGAQNRLVYAKVVEIEPKEDILDWVLYAEIAQHILSSAMDGGLLKPLHFTEFVADEIHVALYPLDKTHILLSISATPDKGVDLATLEKAVEAQLAELAKKAPPNSTFERTFNRRLSYYGYYWNHMPSEQRTMLSHTSFRRKPKPMYFVYDQMALIKRFKFNQFWKAIMGEGRVVVTHLSPQGEVVVAE